MNLIATEIQTSIEDALRGSIKELLPEEIIESDLTDWILEFDALGKREQRGEYRGDYGDVFSGPLIAQMVQSSLTPNVSFYFASLFHLGRQWQVSAQAIETVEQAVQSNNLEATVTQNVTLFQEQLRELDVPEQEHRLMLSDALVEVLQLASQRHLQKIKKAQDWWQIWQREVMELRDITSRYSEEYDNYRRRERKRILPSLVSLVAFSFQTRHLYHSLVQDGIEFKTIGVPNLDQYPFMNIAFLPFILMTEEETGYGLSDQLRHALHDLARSLSYGPIDQKVESELIRDFEGENPFQEYGMLKSPPTSSLMELWNRCRLPSGRMFYYAKNWENSLEPDLYKCASRELPFKSQLSEKHIESYARSVDSTIKRNFVNDWERKDKVGRTDVEFIQYLFEQKCIVGLVKSAVYPTTTRGEKGSQQWNLSNFTELIERIVQFLNARGYTLEIPTKTRLERLWNLAIKGETYGSIW